MSQNRYSGTQTESELPIESESSTEFEIQTESELQTESEASGDTDINHSEVPSEAPSNASVRSEPIEPLHSDNQSEPNIDENSSEANDVPDDVPEPTNSPRGSKRELEDENLEDINNKKIRTESDDDDEGNLCPICFDVWSNQGIHRVCCLRCGHIFGHSCLLRWLNTQGNNKKSCPTCKRKVIKSDIRFLYVKKLIAADTSEIEALRKNLDELKEDKTKLQMEINTLNLQMELRIQKLQLENENLKKLASNSSSYSNIHHQIRKPVNELAFSMQKSLEINANGGCRVLDYSPTLRTIAVSLTSPNPIFAGYGVRKIMMPDYKPTAFIAAHTKAIRDLTFKDNLLLSVSLDAKAKLINMNTNSEVASITCTNPLWSCCWDSDDRNVFYIGESRGTVSIYDVRNLRESLSVIETEGDSSPVVSLASTKFEGGEAMPLGGLLCCKLNSCWAFSKNSGSVSFSQKPLPLEGPFMSLRYNYNTRHILVSARANQRYPYVRHILCELSQYNDSMQCNIVHTFQGAAAQSMLSKSCFVHYNDNIYAAAYHAADKNVTLWSAKTGNKVGSVPAHNPILDVCNIQMQNSNFLTTLNERKLDFFLMGMSK